MMDIVPTSIDGAVVCTLVNRCSIKKRMCQNCDQLVIKIHNWLKYTSLEYMIFDLQDEKEVCPSFLQELMQLRKRLSVQFLFSGVMDRPRKLLEDFNYGDIFPIFLSPEDAVRALRMQNPGLTEVPLKSPVRFEQSLSKTMDAIQQNL